MKSKKDINKYISLEISHKNESRDNKNRKVNENIINSLIFANFVKDMTNGGYNHEK